ncbi:MAG TPA: S9 family peptidase [bacterium]|nr:S9 family peptidase [bacterium]
MIRAMMFRSHRISAFLALGWLASMASAQTGAQLSLATVLARRTPLAAPTPQVLWLPDGHDATVILTAEDGSQTLHRVVDDAVAEEPLVTAAAVRAALALPEREGPARFPALRWLDRDTLRIEHGRAIWRWDLASDRATRVLAWRAPDAGGSAFGDPTYKVSPDDRHVAVRRDHQLFVFDAGGEAHQLTFDGNEDVVYGGAAHRAEIGIHEGLFWSHDGRYLAFYREDLRPIAEYPFQNVDRMPPTPRHGRYPMAGRADSSVRVMVCDTDDYEVVTLEAERGADLYWTNIAFTRDGGIVVALVNRGQDRVELVRFGCASGARGATLLREHDQQWVEPEIPAAFLRDGRFLWSSRRSGYRHLYLHAADGSVLGPVTSGAFDVQSLLAVVDEQRVYFTGSGDDPRQLHLFSADLNGGDQHRITEERGTHDCSLSPDGRRAAVVWSNLETMPTSRLVSTRDGSATPLPQRKHPLAEFALPQQRFVQLEAGDGSTLYGHLALPPDFDPKRRYPVIHYVYGGPHAQLVKDTWFGGAATWLQALASEGFIVSRIDNHGTPNRGIEFEQAIHRHLGTVEVDDQMRMIDWLKQQPFVAADRIGVHGWSFGGYMTLRLMLLHPEAFACGISGAPVTDWRMYETGYTERYMDSPAENPDGYTTSSCLPLAEHLQRPLLLVHGTDDRTVMWSHTLQFVDRCIDAGVHLDYFPYPQQLHGLRGRDRVHFLRRLHRFFTRHLQPDETPR